MTSRSAVSLFKSSVCNFVQFRVCFSQNANRFLRQSKFRPTADIIGKSCKGNISLLSRFAGVKSYVEIFRDNFQFSVPNENLVGSILARKNVICDKVLIFLTIQQFDNSIFFHIGLYKRRYMPNNCYIDKSYRQFINN